MSRLRLSSEVLPPPRARLFPRLLRLLDRLQARLQPSRRQPAAHRLGQRGEESAAWLLHEHGYTIVARNYRDAPGRSGGRGEIDLIAFEGVPPTLVFVEVKTRSREGRFPAERAVNQAKRRHLSRLARAYRRKRHYTGPYRFDLVIIYGLDTPHPRLKLHRDAFRD
jgi:putative endonuclease